MAEATDILKLDGSPYACRWAARNMIPPDIESLRQRFSEITCPTLIIWGREDRIIPALFALLFEADIPKSKLHVFDDCGHAPQLEYPVETTAVIRDWAINNL